MDATGLREYVLNECLNLVLIRHIGAMGDGIATRGLDVVDDLLGRILSATENHMNEQPVAGQTPADGGSDATRSSRHHPNTLGLFHDSCPPLIAEDIRRPW